MNLKECCKKLGEDYDEVLIRLYSEDTIGRFLIKLLSDETCKFLSEKLKAQDCQEAFRATHTLKGICDSPGLSNLHKSSSMLTEALRLGNPSEGSVVLKSQVYIGCKQTVAAIQASG